jgi:tRNA(His) 5'-end guanylyltransferase
MTLPEYDVVNNIIWRQQDATRNSIASLAQANFSHRELQGKNTSQMMDMLVNEKGINWNDLPIYKKRGSSCYKDVHNKWVLDLEMPIITENRDYVEEII